MGWPGAGSPLLSTAAPAAAPLCWLPGQDDAPESLPRSISSSALHGHTRLISRPAVVRTIRPDPTPSAAPTLSLSHFPTVRPPVFFTTFYRMHRDPRGESSTSGALHTQSTIQLRTESFRKPGPRTCHSSGRYTLRADLPLAAHLPAVCNSHPCLEAHPDTTPCSQFAMRPSSVKPRLDIERAWQGFTAAIAQIRHPAGASEDRSTLSQIHDCPA